AARGAVFGAAYGWERPNWFADAPGAETVDSFARTNWFEPVARECAAVRDRVGLSDMSVFSKFDLAGPDITPFLEALGANRAPKPGRIGLTHALTPAGGVLSEFTVTRLGADQAYLTSAAAAEEIDLDVLQACAADFDVTVSNVTDDVAVIGVMGPRAADVLPELADMPWLSARNATLAGAPVRALRLSYIGEAGWELHVAADRAATLFTVLEERAQPHGLGFYGAYAAISMRLEKGYRGWGSDLTTERSPIEAGLAPFVRPEVRDELLTEDPWAMVLLEIEAGEIDPFYAHTLWRADQPVGIVTSGAYGHRTDKVLALAYLRDTAARTDLSVSILGQHRAARILTEPPFDPDSTRMKSGGQT
ncbi:MAG: aminomethyltransferase family protein, partial [Pseudomonadota bacterium]